jgi:hypothetical protein
MFKSNLEPDISATIGSLFNSTTDELKTLLNDDTKFEEIIKDNKQVLISSLFVKNVLRNFNKLIFNIYYLISLHSIYRSIIIFSY